MQKIIIESGGVNHEPRLPIDPLSVLVLCVHRAKREEEVICLLNITLKKKIIQTTVV